MCRIYAIFRWAGDLMIQGTDQVHGPLVWSYAVGDKLGLGWEVGPCWSMPVYLREPRGGRGRHERCCVFRVDVWLQNYIYMYIYIYILLTRLRWSTVVVSLCSYLSKSGSWCCKLQLGCLNAISPKCSAPCFEKKKTIEKDMVGL